MPHLIVKTIYHDVDRVLYYGATPAFHVVGSTRSEHYIALGDTITYEPCGPHMGRLSEETLYRAWHIRHEGGLS